MCYHQVGQGNAMAVALDDDLNEWKKLDSNPITPKTQPGDPHHDKYRSWDPYGWLEGDTYYAIFGGERPGHRQGPQPRRRVEVRRRPHGQHRPRRLDQRGRVLRRLLQAGRPPHAPVHQPPARLPLLPRRLEGRAVPSHLPREDELGGQLVLRPGEPAGRPRPPDHVGVDLRQPGIQDAHRLRLVRHHEPAARPLARRGRHAAHEPAGGNRAAALQRKEEDRTSPSTPTPNWRWRASAATASNWAWRSSAPDAKQFGVKVCCSPGGEEQTLVYYDAAEKKLKVDTTKSSLAEGPKTVEAGPFELKAGRTAQAARLRGQVGRRSVRQRPPGGDAAHLSVPPGQRGREAVLERRPGQRRHPRGVGDDAVEPVLNEGGRRCLGQCATSRREIPASTMVLVALAALVSQPASAQIGPGAVNLLPNPSFEEQVRGGVRGWKSRAWSGEENGRWSGIAGQNRKRCLSIGSEKGTDAAWTATVTVKPDAFYRLSGWIRTKDVRAPSGAAEHPEHAAGTDAGRVGNQGLDTGIDRLPVRRRDRAGNQLPLWRLGQSTGQAWYDDVTLEEIDAPPDDAAGDVTVDTGPPVPYSRDDLRRFHRALRRPGLRRSVRARLAPVRRAGASARMSSRR